VETISLWGNERIKQSLLFRATEFKRYIMSIFDSPLSDEDRWVQSFQEEHHHAYYGRSMQHAACSMRHAVDRQTWIYHCPLYYSTETVDKVAVFFESWELFHRDPDSTW
jgi:hypothetical protein